MEFEKDPPQERQVQLKLLATPCSLTERISGAFFRELPAAPGVYFFRDASGVLLYIGQSANLRKRIGSYRHVAAEQHPRRIRRMVHRTARIEWEVCASAAEAVERERVLLLEHRPPFNRAGLWVGPPWWLHVRLESGAICCRLSRQPCKHAIGPLPSGFRHVHATLMRCAYRLGSGRAGLADYPHGLLNVTVPLSLTLPAPVGCDWLEPMLAFLRGDHDALLKLLETEVAAGTASELEFWAAELDVLRRFAKKQPRMPASSSLPPVTPVQHATAIQHQAELGLLLDAAELPPR